MQRLFHFRFSPYPRHRRGTVLIVVLGVLTILSVMGSSFALMMKTERNASTQYALGVRASMLAQDGVTAAANRLQKHLATQYYSQLDPRIHFGAIDTGGAISYRDPMTKRMVYFGSRDVTEARVPVNFSYPLVHNNAPFIDLDGNGVFTAGLDIRLDEPDPANPVFYDNQLNQATFSGFTHDGVYRGVSSQIAGTFAPGGDRYRLKVIQTNSQLSLNYIDDTLYDWMVRDAAAQEFKGSAFKYMLHFLGSAIGYEYQLRGQNNMPYNPFSEPVIDELYKLRLEMGGSFTSKDQIRDILERHHPGSWKYVKDYVTVHAWPGHDPITATVNTNTYVPSFTQNSYQEKLGTLNTQNPAQSLVGNPSRVEIKPVTLPPVDANTAPLAVLYASLANLSGDARYYYYSTGNLKTHDANDKPGDVNFVEVDELKRSRKYPDFNEKVFATNQDATNFFYKRFNQLDVAEYQVPQFGFSLMREGKLFDRNIHLMHSIRIDPMRADFQSAQGNQYGPGSVKDDYAWNLARAIEVLRPFTSWADFERRVIDNVILGKAGGTPGTFSHPSLGNAIKVCEPFTQFQHPWNPNTAGGNPEMNAMKAAFETWYYEAVADLLRAALNPTPKIGKHNPDANYYQKIDRSDLVYWTVPYIFNSPGVFEVTSVGEVLGNAFNPQTSTYSLRPVAQKSARAIIKVADVIRHHSQKQFQVGFPARPGGFKDPVPLPVPGQPIINVNNPDEFYSSVRLTADPGNPQRSRTVTYPRPANQNIEFMRVRGHRVRSTLYPAPNSDEEKIYYTGYRTADMPDMLYGPIGISHATNEDFPGYVTVRPQDISPFDYEFRFEDLGGNFRYLGVGTSSYRPTDPSPSNMGLKIPLNTNANKYLLFWMPFNETIDTAAAQREGNQYIFGKSKNTHQTAAIASTQERAGSPISNRAGDHTIYSRGLRWVPDGFIFRAFDLEGDFPHYLQYPAGAGFAPSFSAGQRQGWSQQENNISAREIIKFMPSTDIKNMTDDSDDLRNNQDQFQLQTNFPYYEGTVEFWFKSDVDQWDMAMGGVKPTNNAYTYDRANDTFMGGFLCATNLLFKEANNGIIGTQTFFYREMHNYLVVSRLLFMDALRVEGNSPTLKKWTSDSDDYPFLNWLYQRGDIVKNNTPPPAQHPDPDWEADMAQLDTGDYGFMYCRYEAWVNLSDLYDRNAEEGFLWRPHEWYHLAVTFRSDFRTLRNNDNEIGSAIDFFLNGIWIDSPNTLSKMPGSRNWPAWYFTTPDTPNDGAYVNKPAPKNQPHQARKWATIINEINPESRLVIGAITRRQATQDQIDAYNNSPNRPAGAPDIEQEMFYFANGEFVAPANGTIDSLRITNRYLSIPRNGFARTFDDGDLDRIRNFARYNTEPGLGTTPDELGTYENGFPNQWGTDVVIANVTWNEYRPKWDSARSMPFDGQGIHPDYDDAPRVEMEFRTFRPTDGGNGIWLRRVDGPSYHMGYGRFTSPAGFGATNDPTDIVAKLSPLGGIENMGRAFDGAFILPANGCFVYTARFMSSTDVFSVANSAAILDEVTITVLTPVEVLTYEEITN